MGHSRCLAKDGEGEVHGGEKQRRGREAGDGVCRQQGVGSVCKNEQPTCPILLLFIAHRNLRAEESYSGLEKLVNGFRSFNSQ